MRASRVLLASVAVVILWGCTSDNRGTLPDADFFVRQGQAFLIRVGDTAGVQTTTTIVIVQLSDVLNDSRCPVDVTCVTAGHATVRLSVQTALAVQDVNVEVPPDAGVDVVVEEVTIEVLELRPPARDGVTIDLLDYQIVLRVIETGSIGIP